MARGRAGSRAGAGGGLTSLFMTSYSLMVRAKEATARRCVRGVNTRLVHHAVPLMMHFCSVRSLALHSRTVPSRPAVA